MTAPELKPCPFCGGDAEIWRAHEGRTAWVACMGRCAVLVSKEYTTDAEAIAAWNTRADTATRNAAIVAAADEVEKEIAQAKTLMPMVVPILRGVHRNILALIAKGAADDRA